MENMCLMYVPKIIFSIGKCKTGEILMETRITIVELAKIQI